MRSRLLLSEWKGDGITRPVDESEVSQFLGISARANVQLYGLIEQGAVVAAINGVHRRQTWQDALENYRCTFFNMFASHPDKRGQGHIPMLLGHLAEQAILHGDSEVLVGCGDRRDHRRKYLERLGFLPHRHRETVGHSASTWLDIDAKGLIDKTKTEALV